MDQEWDNRILCSDGNCIGVIGSDGRCKECGKPYEGRLPENFSRQPSPAAPDPASRTESKAADPSPPPAAEPDGGEQAAGNEDWDNRILCSDGNCIGVIGSDGRCKECGKPFTPEPSD